MKGSCILQILASATLAFSSSHPPKNISQRRAEASVEERGGPPCNIGGCLGAVAATAAGAVACAVIPVPGVDAVCEGSVIASGVISTLTACAGCAIIGKCDPGDTTAIDDACGTPDSRKAELGPNQCLQLSSSVPHPSDTDQVLGAFTMHCHNTAKVVSGNFGDCAFPCANCTQCAGKPH
ncbi:hypothetical protein EV356DRAFT_520555 [Viridothelium virens]|uniref:Uncharacterized protein n=1 Tax=Viridothelium virens TaxID=1048519 RepID=A0A6A6GVS9_VIRVR|nr:hypothetical protein EV356DRAFT_520555 [Viridothelium virens]